MARTIWACFWLMLVQVLARQQDDPRLRQGEEPLREKRAEFGEAVLFGPSETVSIRTRLAPDGTVQILPPLTGVAPHTTGTIETSLDSRQTLAPLLTQAIATPTVLLSATGSLHLAGMALPQAPTVSDIFARPIATSAPPGNLKVRKEHPVPRKGVASVAPIHTNKFYTNFFLGNQTDPTFTHPYSVHWAAGKGPTGSYGLGISHIEDFQRVYGATRPSGAVPWYINPVGIQSLVLGAKELGRHTILSGDSMSAFSVHVRLRKDAGSTPAVSFPLVQGMGFVTALYSGAIPTIQTGVYFKNVTRVAKDPKPDVAKYKLMLEDGRKWFLYARKTQGDHLDLHVVNNGYAEARRPFYGSIQVAKDPGNCEPILDEAAGIYPTDSKLGGAVAGMTGSYSFQFERKGRQDGKLLMFALPHHVSSFDGPTKNAMTAYRLQTTTKGMATGVVSDKWTMVENHLPANMNFAPFDPALGPANKLSEEAKKFITSVAKLEVSQNMTEQALLDSMYFSGKVRAL
jgi:endo-1,3(4)-beta-glucanase